MLSFTLPHLPSFLNTFIFLHKCLPLPFSLRIYSFLLSIRLVDVSSTMPSRFQFFCQHIFLPSFYCLLQNILLFPLSVSRSFFSEIFSFSFFSLYAFFIPPTSRHLVQPFVSHFVSLSLSLFFIDNHASPSSLFSLSIPSTRHLSSSSPLPQSRPCSSALAFSTA